MIALQEVKRILDELSVIEDVIMEQKKVISNLSKLSFTPGKEPNFGITIGLLLEGIEKLRKEAHRVETSFNNLLDLKQKQASLEEAIAARRQEIHTTRQAHRTAEQLPLANRQSQDTELQNLISFVFTAVTVIFVSPLVPSSLHDSSQVEQFPRGTHSFW